MRKDFYITIPLIYIIYLYKELTLLAASLGLNTSQYNWIIGVKVIHLNLSQFVPQEIEISVTVNLT